MSVLAKQNILGGGQGPARMGAGYSFGPPTSKRTGDGSFIYNSPTRSYAPDKAAALVMGNTAGEFPMGVDGTAVLKGENTTYGGSVNGGRLASTDSSLLTGIAKVIAGSPVQNKYKAIDYFQTRTPRATKSFHQSGAGANVQGGNGGGSGAQRAFYHYADQYPDEILTGGDSEWVPTRPEGGAGTGLMNLIPLTPGGGDGSEEKIDNYEQPNQSGNGPSGENDSAEGENFSNDPTDRPSFKKDSVVEVEYNGQVDQSGNGGVTEELTQSDGYVDPNAERWESEAEAAYNAILAAMGPGWG